MKREDFESVLLHCNSAFSTNAETEAPVHREHHCSESAKADSAPSVSRGFRNGVEDLEIGESIVIYPGHDAIPLGEGIVALGLHDALEWIRKRVAG